MKAIRQVFRLKSDHRLTWREKAQSYWLARLMQEVGELASSLVGEHNDPPEWELSQIAAISMNWLEMRSGEEGQEFPTVVCLCGSTKFIDAFQKAEFDETLAGRIVLTIGCDAKSDSELFHGAEGERVKERLDELHKRKIDLADEVLVLNVGGYIGNSTRSEIDYAMESGKPIRYLESTFEGPA